MLLLDNFLSMFVNDPLLLGMQSHFRLIIHDYAYFVRFVVDLFTKIIYMLKIVMYRCKHQKCCCEGECTIKI